MLEEKIFENILNQIQESVIVINTNENIIFINDSACRILNLEKEKILSKNVIDIIPNTRLHIVLRTGEPELDRLQNLGNKIIITSRIPIKNENNETQLVVAVFRDITTVQKLAEEITNLKEIEATLTSIIDSTSDAISVADQEGRVVMVNKAYTRITGLTPREVIGKPASIDIAEGESLHIRCAREKKHLFNVKMKIRESKKDVIASVAPLFVKEEFKGSVAVIHDITEIQRLMNELEATRRILKKQKAKYNFDDIVSKSQVMKNIIKQSQKASITKVNILIVGEYGVGKEILAQAIHNSSERKDNSYFKLNFSMIPENSQDNMLFGENSYIRKANEGTLFIENIHLLNKNNQEKLLKFLKDEYIENDFANYKPDVRFMFSTTEDLKMLVSIGKFSRELFYKISVVTIKVPPLRERKDDILVLAKQILHSLNQKYGRVIYDFTEDALNKLLNYQWNGNIRELENVIDRSILNLEYQDNVITSSHIPELNEVQEKNLGNLKELIEEYERKIIIETLEVSHGNKTEAAKKLGLTVRNLYYKLERYNIK